MLISNIAIIYSFIKFAKTPYGVEFNILIDRTFPWG